MIAAPNSTVTLNAQIPDLGLTSDATTAAAAPSATKEGMSTMTIILIVLGAALAFIFAWFFLARKSERVYPVEVKA
jgi:hypothetical protein